MTDPRSGAPPRRPRVDEADLVLVASIATGERPERVLAECDLADLASVAAALDAPAVTSGLDAAAVAMLEIGRRRPFARGNAATAWLAAAHCTADDGLRLRIRPATARTVFAAAADLDAAVVREVLAEHSEPVRSLAGRVLRALFWPRPLDGPGVFRCPTCDRPLVQRPGDMASAGGVWAETTRIERVARCAVEHGAHGRHARRRPQPGVAVGA